MQVTPLELNSKRETVTSPHTGRPLRRGSVRFSVGGQELNDEIVAALGDASEVPLTARLDGEELSFLVTNRSYSTRQGSDVFEHDVELEESEELNPDALIFNDELSIQPYRYEERYEDDKEAIAIEAWVELDEAESEQFEQFLFDHRNRRDEATTYFPVVRQGIHDDALEMRFGQCRWSQHGESVKQHIVLVERSYDDADSRVRIFHPEMENLKQTAAETSAMLDLLIEALVEGDVIARAGVERLREQLEKQAWRKHRGLFQMDDADEA